MSKPDNMSKPDRRDRSSASLLLRDWPYILMLVLALFGVAYTSISRQTMAHYWMLLVPVFATTCVFVRWRDVKAGEFPWRMVRIEALQWGAVMLAMYLVLVSDVRRAMSAEAVALVVLILLALGTFIAGIHIGGWRISLVGVVLAVGVPIIAWLEERTLLFALGVMVVLPFSVLLFRHGNPSPHPHRSLIPGEGVAARTPPLTEQ